MAFFTDIQIKETRENWMQWSTNTVFAMGFYRFIERCLYQFNVVASNPGMKFNSENVLLSTIVTMVVAAISLRIVRYFVIEHTGTLLLRSNLYLGSLLVIAGLCEDLSGFMDAIVNTNYNAIVIFVAFICLSVYYVYYKYYLHTYDLILVNDFINARND